MKARLCYTLRADRVIFWKFRYIAGAEGYSANKMLEKYIKWCVTEYESVHGSIPYHLKNNNAVPHAAQH